MSFGALSVDYRPKILQVAIRDTSRLVDLSGERVDNGLVYDPSTVFAKINNYAETLYAEFFRQGELYQVVSIVTESGPGELVRSPQFKRFGVEYCLWIGGIIAPFRVPEDKAQALLEDIAKHPDKYAGSLEKEMFAPALPEDVRPARRARLLTSGTR